ncbi:MAG TPA: hypothetical protein VHA70_02155 [Bauldia sp.]|nr:hypothetical protein [Bauldia sp.]
MFRRIFNLVLLVAMIIGAAVTYDMKHKAEMAADKVARLQAEIAKEKDKIAVLRAEWAMLTQPARLQSVVDKYADYFKLQPFSPKQLATIDEIPLKQSPVLAPNGALGLRTAGGP